MQPIKIRQIIKKQMRIQPAIKLLFLSIIGLALGLVFVQGSHAQEVPQGDPVEGGKLYDNWYNALDQEPPEGNHPLWRRQEENSLTGPKTWRCQECHGWDYKGVDGAYGEGDHFTGFSGVQGVIGDSNEDIRAWLDGSRDANHNFTPYINNTALDDLVAFLRTKQVDVALMIDYDSRTALGNKENGEVLYLETCVSCHGENGKRRNFANATNPVYLGDVAWQDPWRAVHKIRFGHPASNMPASENLGWTLQEVADVLAYMQTLPTARPPIDPTLESTRAMAIRLEEQGEISPVIYATVAIMLIILVSAGISALRKPK
jgi:cytochrome c553